MHPRTQVDLVKRFPTSQGLSFQQVFTRCDRPRYGRERTVQNGVEVMHKVHQAWSPFWRGWRRSTSLAGTTARTPSMPREHSQRCCAATGSTSSRSPAAARLPLLRRYSAVFLLVQTCVGIVQSFVTRMRGFAVVVGPRRGFLGLHAGEVSAPWRVCV